MLTNRERLVRQVNDKVQPAYRELFADLYGALVCFCAGYVGRHETAEDVVQDVLVKLWESDVKFETYNNMVTWLYLAVRNAALDLVKRRKVEQKYIAHALENPDPIKGTDYDILREEVYRELMRVVEELPPRCREIFRLYIQGHDGPTIAGMLNLSVETVRTHRKHALRVMRDRLGHLFILAVAFELF